MPIRSYVRSTDFHRKPCGEYILGCVNIPVMVSPTLRTLPFSDGQRQLFNDVSTIATPFGTRKPTVNLDQCTPIPFTLVFKLPHQFTPTRITDRKGKFPILHHVLHRQVLNGDRLVFTYQSSRQLVKKIFSGIRNLLMHLCDFEPRFVSIIRSLLLATQRLLSFFELAVFGSKTFGVCNLFTRTQSDKTGYAQVNPDLIRRVGQGFNLDIDQQGDRPSSRRREFHRNRRGCCAFRQFSAPTDRQRLGGLSKVHLPVFPFESGLGELCTTAVAFLLEVGIFRPSLKEVAKRFLKVSQSLLQGDTAYVIQKLEVILFFPFRQLCRSIAVPDSLLVVVPGFGSQRQSAVIDQASTAHRLSKQGFLLRSRIETVPEGFLRHVSHYNVCSVRSTSDWAPARVPVAIPPCAKAAGFLARFR